MRKPIIAGNWKMNNTIAETKNLLNELKPLVKDSKVEVVVCVPYTDLYIASELLKGSNIKLGAENVHWADKGAFTGEISADMLKELNVEYVIIGHSERRQYFGETDETVNKRAKQALLKNLKPIICVGESLEERETNKVEAVIVKQTTEALKDISVEDMKNVVIAYEPIWAIGTGKTATSKEANDTIKIVRDTVSKLYGQTIAESLRIQYGGSMKPENVKELMSMPEIDGGLIGGASLKAIDFSKIVNY